MLAPNIKEITDGYDGYDFGACALDDNASMYALILESHPYHNPPQFVKEIMRDCVIRMFEDLKREVNVQIWRCRETHGPGEICRHEPYISSEAMQQDVRDHGRLFMRDRYTGPIVGYQVMKWRAVHDYYGHVVNRAPFNLRGEMAAMHAHVVQFPRVCWPFIWNNVVLENAYRLNRGKFLCWPNKQCGSKIVFDEHHFGVECPDDWYHRYA